MLTRVVAMARALAVMATVVALAGTAQSGAGRGSMGSTGSYTVRPGDTLSHLAARFRVPLADLAAANGIANVHRVRSGHRLTIPGQAAQAGAAPAPAPAAQRDVTRLPVRLRQSPERLALLPRFEHWAATYGVPADLFMAMTWMESGWQNGKVSRARAMGIGQLMPDTVTFVSKTLLRTKLDPSRPDDNIRMSARFLRYLLDQAKGDTRLAVAAYYQGLASVRRRGVLPVTKAYVDDVLALRSHF